MWTISTQRGSLPLTAKLCISSGSTEMAARPFTRKVSPTPGIRNSSAMRGSRMMLRKPSMRLLPGRAGMASVFSSRMRTKPCASPLGEQSSPAGRHRHERRRLDQFAVAAVDVVDLLDDGGRRLFAVERFKLLHGRYQMITCAHIPFPLCGQQLPAVMPHHREIEKCTGFDG